MKTIKTLLVDDDYLVIQDLKNLVDWNKLGFQITGTATNGKTALALATKQKPELIITDISMPVMDGFDFIETVKKDFPNTYIIFISSYASFTYAQRAMENGIRDYILKNEITSQLLEERLLKVAKTLHNNRQISQEQLCSKLSAYFHFKADQLPDMPFFSQKYIFLFFSLHLPLEKLKLHFLHLSQYGRKLYDVLAPIVSAGYPHSFSAVTDEIVILCINPADINQPVCNTSVSILCHLFQKQAQELCRCDVISWYDPGSYSLSHGRTLYQTVLPYLHFYGSFPTESVMNLESFTQQPFVPVRTLFPYHLLEEGMNDFQLFFSQLYSHLQLLFDAQDADSIFMLYHNLLLQMEELTNHMISFPATNSFHSLQEIYDFFVHCYQQIKEYQNKNQYESFSVPVHTAIEYMKKNLSDNNLTIDQIAEATYLSSSRLSVLFKKETGQTVNDYLTDLRISHAIHLLENSNYKIYEIAEKTGYKSSQYFSQVFNQRTGRRPLSFRQKKPSI